MDNAIKIHTECNIPITKGHIGNNTVLSMEEKFDSSNECIPMDVRDKKLSKQEFGYFQGDTFSININSCKFIQKKKNIISKKKIAPNRNCLRAIAPKVGDAHLTKTGKNVCLDPKKRKDDKRRATHNEIERRRRNNINNCIFKLKGLIPEIETTDLSAEMDCKARSADSKSQILIRAYDYIQYMQEELKSLRDCIKENDQLRLSNEELNRKINQLQNHVA